MRNLLKILKVLAVAGLALAAAQWTAVGIAAQDAVPVAEPTPVVDGRFGAIESFWAPQEAAELGVGWERILFYWNEIEPTGPGDWNTLHVLEEWLVEAETHDRKVLGLLKNTPAWATDGEPYSGVPRGLFLDIDDPENLWAGYVGRVVDYYSSRGVHDWVIWNEPEIKAGVYGHEFDGDVADYVRLLKVAYLVAKERDPEAVIHLAGYSYWHDPDYLKAFFEELTADPEAAQNDYYFDMLSLHIYFRVETVWSLVKEIDALQNSFGIDKPIWINETNAAPNLDPWWPVERPMFQVDLDQQAWFVIQAHALGFAAGADSVGIYKLIDILLPPGGESFGVLRPDYSRRPAYLAYKTTINLLQGFEAPVAKEETDTYTAVTFHKPEQVVRILWARQDKALTLVVPALAPEATLVDYVGNESKLTATGGEYSIDLGGARCRDACDIGGPPVFLVEQVSDAAVQAPIVATPSLATLTATPEMTLTFTPWPPTPSPTPTATSTPTITPSATATETPRPSPSATEISVAKIVPTSTAVPGATASAAADSSDTGSVVSWIVLRLALAAAVLFALRKWLQSRAA